MEKNCEEKRERKRKCEKIERKQNEIESRDLLVMNFVVGHVTLFFLFFLLSPFVPPSSLPPFSLFSLPLSYPHVFLSLLSSLLHPFASKHVPRTLTPSSFLLIRSLAFSPSPIVSLPLYWPSLPPTSPGSQHD